MEDLRARYEELLSARKGARASRGGAGECMTFCPELEGLERMLRNDVSGYEAEVMIKKYRRPSGGGLRELSEDIRPVGVLVSVMNHIIGLCADDQSIQMYKFAENRIRAVVSDMKAQRSKGAAAIEILEKTVRFYIVFRYLLHDHPHFNKDMNLGQARVVMTTLMGLYGIEAAGSEGGNNFEEFCCYHMLVSMGEKHVPKMTEKAGGPRIKLSVEVLRKYMQNNVAGFFELLKRLDYISFCMAQSFAGKVRARSIDMFKRSLAEKVDIGFLGDVLGAREPEVEGLMRRKGISVGSGKADFSEKTAHEEPGEDVPYCRRMEISVKCPAVFILQGPVDYRVFMSVLCEVLRKRLWMREPCTATHEPSVPKENGSTAESKEDVKGICIAILEEVVRKVAINVFSGITRLNVLGRYLARWRSSTSQRNGALREKNKYLLLIILDREVSSIPLMKCIYSSDLGSLMPTVIQVEQVTVEEMLMYNLCIFSAPERRHESLYNEYHMVNLIVDTPQGLARRAEEVYERAVNAPKARKSTLLTLLHGMNKVQATEVILRLIDNGKNHGVLERNLALLYENKPLVECNVYYEEGSIYSPYPSSSPENSN